MDRFWKKVSVGSADECWEWLGSRLSSNYGAFWFQGKNAKAHRFSLALNENRDLSEIPPTTQCCHSCDNPVCVNPNHLWWGTAKQNKRDCANKGRSHGKNGPQKLLPEDDEFILAMTTNENFSWKDLQLFFGVSKGAIQHARERARKKLKMPLNSKGRWTGHIPF